MLTITTTSDPVSIVSERSVQIDCASRRRRCCAAAGRLCQANFASRRDAWPEAQWHIMTSSWWWRAMTPCNRPRQLAADLSTHALCCTLKHRARAWLACQPGSGSTECKSLPTQHYWLGGDGVVRWAPAAGQLSTTHFKRATRSTQNSCASRAMRLRKAKRQWAAGPAHRQTRSYGSPLQHDSVSKTDYMPPTHDGSTLRASRVASGCENAGLTPAVACHRPRAAAHATCAKLETHLTACCGRLVVPLRGTPRRRSPCALRCCSCCRTAAAC